MGLKFDEAVNMYDGDDLDFLIEQHQVIDIMEQLREEYAPTVEMTKEQKELVLFYKENTWFSVFIGKLNDPDNAVYNSLPSLLAFKYWGFGKERERQLMQAWLQPDTIKVVDE